MYKQDILKGWQFRQLGTEKWFPALLPGNVYTDLMLNGQIKDPLYQANAKDLQWVGEADWEYKTSFVVEKKQMEFDVLELIFEGLDTYTDIYLNEELILSTNNMHHPWRVEVKDKIIPDDFELVFKEVEQNELRIVFHSPTKKSLDTYKTQGYILPASEAETAPRLSVYNRKSVYHFGSTYTPRLLAGGIWRGIQLLGWSQARIDHIQYSLLELENKFARLSARFEVIAAKEGHALFRIRSKDDGLSTVMEPAKLKPGLNIIELDFEILHPRLWWPHAMGNPDRYEMRGEMTIDAEVAHFVEDKIGLRTIELINDDRGAGAYFQINGQPLFVKGTNWLPPHYFPHKTTTKDYRHLLGHVLDANMNMLRVWGGGIYEQSDFYELCDELGILVWQDFMFTEGLYPAYEEMQNAIREEVEHQLKRLRNRSCLALWCGNEGTEIAWKSGQWQKRYGYTSGIRDKVWSDYQKIFYDLLPHLIAKHDDGRLYIPSYPQPEESGVSFIQFIGYPAPSHPATIASYTEISDRRLESEVMTFHQSPRDQVDRAESPHHRIARDLVALYPPCPDFDWWIYLGQVHQAEYSKQQIEAIRRARPESMGIIYRLFHDCWPATSEASIDYEGRWKALQYFLQNAFSQMLVSPYLEDDQLKVVILSDKREAHSGLLELSLADFEGNIVHQISQKVQIPSHSSQIHYQAPLDEWLKGKSPTTHLLLSSLSSNGAVVNKNRLYFSPTKSLALQKPDLSTTFIHTNDTYRIELLSNTLMKNVYLSLKSAKGFFSDNYFDLLPGKPYEITLSPVGSELNLGEELSVQSMVDLM